MRKLMKLSLCLLMVIGLAACGGTASTEKQEKVVTDFFVNLKAGDIEKVSQLCTSTNVDVKDFTSAKNSLAILQNADTFGDKFAEEGKKFATEYFNQFVVSYEVKEAKKDGDNYTVATDVVLKKIDSNTFSITAAQKLATAYQNDHLSELQKIYKEKGQKALQEALYTGIATDYFKQANENIAKSKDEKYKMTFTLVPEGDNWLISKSVAFEAK